jgi:hypothetical protein
MVPCSVMEVLEIEVTDSNLGIGQERQQCLYQFGLVRSSIEHRLPLFVRWLETHLFLNKCRILPLSDAF